MRSDWLDQFVGGGLGGVGGGCLRREAGPRTDTLTIGAYSVVRMSSTRPSFPASPALGTEDRAASFVRRIVQRLGGPGAGDRLGL